MLLDNSETLSESQAITTSANSTNIIDLGAAAWWGADQALYSSPIIGLGISETFLAAGAATLTIAVRSTTANDYTTGLKTHYVSDAIPKASLTTSVQMATLFNAFIPRGAGRYFHINYAVATGPFTAGKIVAKVDAAAPNNR